MQVTTTTITTETMNVESDNFKITIFEQRTAAFCDTCPNEASGTKAALEAQGWFLGSREQFCPECN